MNTRLILAIFSSLLEEAALAGIVLWGLPRLGIDMPIAGLVTLMVALAAYDVTAYRMGSRALRKKPVAGLHTMVGTKGKTVRPLAPKGLVSIKGELWEAESPGANIDVGEEIVVVAQDGLKLTVRRSCNKD
jgi:membrane-bound serine protease (ClpP class)